MLCCFSHKHIYYTVQFCSHNFTIVVSIARVFCIQEWAKLGVQRHWFSTIDFQPPSLPAIWSGVRVIDECGRKKESVYVHCKAGKGRSTIVVACYLMKVHTALCVCVCSSSITSAAVSQSRKIT